MVLKDYIQILELSDLSDLYSECKNNEEYMQPAVTMSGHTDHRQCYELFLIPAAYEHFPAELKKIYDKCDKLFDFIIEQYTAKFPYCKKTLSVKHAGFHILKYNPGNFYKEHVDDFREMAYRRLSVSIGLNSDFTGGEFAFFGGQELYSLGKNQALIFPSSWQYPHQILPVKTGERWSIVFWVI